ncbi:MAG: hypothetical protein HZB59_13500 [Ignavibacteriales bacterium]|nr:hypothetical protein [Ignavibacteriales bacterium]
MTEVRLILGRYKDWKKIFFRLCMVVSIQTLCLFSTSVSQILPFKTYSVKDGLPSNDIEVIAQDSYGRMWFGTTDGVSVYDGQTFTNFTTHDGLPGNFVNQILPDRNIPGIVWIIAGSRLCKFIDNSITRIQLNAGSVISIHQDNRGVIWCGTDVGVFTIDGDSVSRFKPYELNDQIERIAEVGDSVLWFSRGSLLISYSRRTGRIDRLDCKPYGNGNLWKLFVDKAGLLYALMGDSVSVRIRDGRVVGTRRNPATPIDAVEDIENNIWFGGYGGISKIQSYRFAHASFQHFTTLNGLQENTVRCVYVDKEQNLWIGGRDKGLAKLSIGYSIRFPLGYLWYWHHHRIAAADSSNHLWVVSDQDLLEVWRDKFQIWHSMKHGIYNGIVSPIEHKNGAIGGVTIDKSNRLWMTKTENPSWVVECYEIERSQKAQQIDDQPSKLKKIKTISLRNTLLEKGIFSIVVSKTGDVWVGSHGIARLDPKSKNPIVRIYDTSDGIPENYIRELYEDRHGNIWAGSLREGAIKIAPDGKINHYTNANGLPDNGIWSFIEDEKGLMMIGTSNGGLAMLNGDSIAILSQREGLPSNKIECATRDSSGRLWLGTSIGLIYEDHPGSKSFIKNPTFLGSGVPCAGTTRSGMVWFITPTDLWVYDYTHDRKNTILPPVYITNLNVNGFRREVKPIIELSHNEANCEIGFIGISFKDEGAIRYKYRLINSDENWQEPTFNRSITYGHLDPGSYRFEVKAINLDGLESAAPASITINIAPPYWRTWWFGGIIFVGILLIIWIISSFKTARILKEQQISREFSRQLIDSQEAERKRVAGELHDGLGQEMMVIINRAQMGLNVTETEKMKLQLTEISQTASRAIENVRDIAYNLSPYHIDQLGLIESVKSMVDKIAELSHTIFTTNVFALDQIADKKIGINIYRIIQECLNNIVKHSDASEASLIAEQHENELVITVRDNGKGFDNLSVTNGAGARKGFGLVGLSERVKLLNGTLEIKSSQNQGTTIIITIPYINTNKDF